MADEPKVIGTTETTTRTFSDIPALPAVDSTIWGTSVRAWLAIILAGTVAFTQIAVVIAVLVNAVIKNDFSGIGTWITISEPLYGMAIAAMVFYFSKATGKTG